MLFLLTSRVRVGVPENQDSELESSETDETSQSCDDENSENYPLFKENDYVIIWLASNLSWSNLRCTISASTNAHDVRLNYYGTIQDLRNGPPEVHQNSRCMMLSHYHCDKMTENGLKSVRLDVEIHEAQLAVNTDKLSCKMSCYKTLIFILFIYTFVFAFTALINISCYNEYRILF